MSLIISSEYIFHSPRPTGSPSVEKVTLPVTIAVLDDVTSLSLTGATSQKKNPLPSDTGAEISCHIILMTHFIRRKQRR